MKIDLIFKNARWIILSVLMLLGFLLLFELTNFLEWSFGQKNVEESLKLEKNKARKQLAQKWQKRPPIKKTNLPSMALTMFGKPQPLKEKFIKKAPWSKEHKMEVRLAGIVYSNSQEMSTVYLYDAKNNIQAYKVNDHLPDGSTLVAIEEKHIEIEANSKKEKIYLSWDDKK